MSVFSIFKPIFIEKSGQWKEVYYLLVAHPRNLLIRKLVESVGAKANKILDIGGRKSPYTRRLKGHITILDKVSDSGGYLGYTEQFVEASKRDGSVEIVIGDAMDMPFPDNAFDLFLCIEVIEHIQEDDKVVAEMARVLSPCSCGLITTPNGGVVPNINPYHVRHYQPDEFEILLLQNFKNVQVFSIDHWKRLSYYLNLKLQKFRLFDIIVYSLLRPIYFILNFLTPSSSYADSTGAVLVAIVSDPKK